MIARAHVVGGETAHRRYDVLDPAEQPRADAPAPAWLLPRTAPDDGLPRGRSPEEVLPRRLCGRRLRAVSARRSHPMCACDCACEGAMWRSTTEGAGDGLAGCWSAVLKGGAPWGFQLDRAPGGLPAVAVSQVSAWPRRPAGASLSLGPQSARGDRTTGGRRRATFRVVVKRWSQVGALDTSGRCKDWYRLKLLDNQRASGRKHGYGSVGNDVKTPPPALFGGRPNRTKVQSQMFLHTSPWY